MLKIPNYMCLISNITYIYKHNKHDKKCKFKFHKNGGREGKRKNCLIWRKNYLITKNYKEET